MTDEWGQDPSIRFMRRVFQSMETIHKELLDLAGISPFDARLRDWREAARNLFEQGWTLAASRGFGLGEEQASVLYAHCFAKTLRAHGFEIPNERLPRDEKLSKLIQEVPS
jgi:hypothetical protein